MNDPVALCAGAVADWHAAWLTALGLRWETDAGVWRALDRPPAMYFTSITLRPDLRHETVMDSSVSVCDNWQSLSLEPFGFSLWRTEPWFLRRPAPVSAPAPPELEIVRVSTPREVEEFEAVSVQGFEHEGASIPPGTIHPPSVLDEPRMAMFTARVGGRAVGAAMAYVSEDAVGVFGVTVVASARRRGYGTALTCAAMLPETGLPSVLAPSPEGVPLYLRLGYTRVGELSIWTRTGG